MCSLEQAQKGIHFEVWDPLAQLSFQVLFNQSSLFTKQHMNATHTQTNKDLHSL